jgi:hypothetical protein
MFIIMGRKTKNELLKRECKELYPNKVSLFKKCLNKLQDKTELYSTYQTEKFLRQESNLRKHSSEKELSIKNKKKSEQLENMDIKTIYINTLKTLYNIIDDFIDMDLSKRSVIDNFKEVLHILTKNNRLIYVGIISLIISILFYFIDTTS